MKNWLWLILLVAFSAQAYESVILNHKYDDIFPPGVAGDDWFSKLAHDGHKLRLVKDGSDVMEERLNLIRSAQRSILLSTFIYDTDETSLEITNALCMKAKLQGIDVRMIVDSFGAKKFYKKESDRLRKCGVGIIMFSPGKWDLLKFVQSMHEKLIIIDGHTVYMGGRGIQNSYHHVKPAKKFFHDMDIIVEGPIACWWQFKFIDTYSKARSHDKPDNALGNHPNAIKNDEYLYGKRDYPACYPFKRGNSRVVPVYGNPLFNKTKTPIEDVYVKALENLEHGATVKLYAPYFVPTTRFGAALIKAKKEKNAQISIITNSIESNDEGVAILVAMSYSVDHLMAAGIDIRIYPGPMTLHRKVGIYGGKYGHIGSDNLDNRGQHYQTESVIITDDMDIVSELEAEFDEDYNQTMPLDAAYIQKIRKKPGFFERIFAKEYKEFF
ncbi:MAG TPA: phosphatidylserine/phosphatidylglycerophosphate/cardiolipin synthase family protein [Bacteriovoracaceae bacterium]|nr:phosphatidylserine/phosphatidylglycerophosphate/cardiolipin synthase family protein [Bacteriovoracaceae bacterium]